MDIRFLIISVICTFILFGCMNNKDERNAKGNDEPPVEQTGNTTNFQSNEDIANHLANIAQGVPDVNNAYAVVAGPYAVVGIDIDEDLERQRVGTIKFSVAEALQEDPYGKTAVVVADADATERIRMMAEKIREGQPIQGILDELAEVVARYMPTFPVDEQNINIEENEEEYINEFESENNLQPDENRER